MRVTEANEVVPEERIRGALSGDALFGSPLLLVCDDGRRIQLVLPGDWRRTSAPGALLDSSGTVVATMIDRIEVTGRFTQQMGSIHQAGPLFMVTGMIRVDPTG